MVLGPTDKNLIEQTREPLKPEKKSWFRQNIFDIKISEIFHQFLTRLSSLNFFGAQQATAQPHKQNKIVAWFRGSVSEYGKGGPLLLKIKQVWQRFGAWKVEKFGPKTEELKDDPAYLRTLQELDWKSCWAAIQTRRGELATLPDNLKVRWQGHCQERLEQFRTSGKKEIIEQLVDECNVLSELVSDSSRNVLSEIIVSYGRLMALRDGRIVPGWSKVDVLLSVLNEKSKPLAQSFLGGICKELPTLKDLQNKGLKITGSELRFLDAARALDQDPLPPDWGESMQGMSTAYEEILKANGDRTICLLVSPSISKFLDRFFFGDRV